MYPRIVRQMPPMGETALSSAVEAVSGRCQCIWEFMRYQMEPAARVWAAIGTGSCAPCLRRSLCRSLCGNSGRDAVGAHVRLQRLRNAHAAVGLLIVLQNGNPRTSYRQRAAIQRVKKFSLVLSLRTVADIRPPCPKSFEVRARRNLAKKILSREPDFNVISLGRRESHIGGTQRDHAVVQAEFLQHSLGVVRQLLQFVVRSFGT